MRLGLTAGQFGPKLNINFDLILEAERLGYSSIWTAEAYGNDAVVPCAYISSRTSKIDIGTAIMQMQARTPAMTAMTAMTLDSLSGGRFRLGLGPSGRREGAERRSLPPVRSRKGRRSRRRRSRAAS